MLLHTLLLLLLTIAGHVHVVIIAVGVVLHLLRTEDARPPGRLGLSAGHGLSEAEEVLAGIEVEVVGLSVTDLDRDFRVGTDKSGVESVGSNPVVLVLLSTPGVQLTVRGVDRMVKQILGRHDAVLHLDGPHVLALTRPLSGSDLGVARGGDVEGGVVILQVIIALGGSPRSAET